MKKSTIAIIVFIIIILGIYFMMSSNTSKTQKNVPPVNTGINTPSVVSDVTVNIKNFAFSPSVVTIKSGTKVTWTNNDSAPHTITSDSGSFLDSSPIAPGQSFSFTFSNPSTIKYHCAIHPMMRGEIVVQ